MTKFASEGPQAEEAGGYTAAVSAPASPVGEAPPSDAEPWFASLRERLPDDAPNRWVDLSCRYCKDGSPCLTHDRRPRTLAQNRVIFGPSFGYEPTVEDRREAGL